MIAKPEPEFPEPPESGEPYQLNTKHNYAKKSNALENSLQKQAQLLFSYNTRMLFKRLEQRARKLSINTRANIRERVQYCICLLNVLRGHEQFAPQAAERSWGPRLVRALRRAAWSRSSGSAAGSARRAPSRTAADCATEASPLRSPSRPVRSRALCNYIMNNASYI